MIWLTWRQARTQVAVVYAVLAAVLTALAITRTRLPHLGDPRASIYDRLTSLDRTEYFAGLLLIAVVPALLGAFWGAPLVAREIEAGTHRLVWNQSVTRSRWLSAKLGLTVLVGAAAVGLLSAFVSWWAVSLDGSDGDVGGSLPARLTPVAFAMRGTVPVAYAVFAIVLGATLGAVLRRTVPAMAITLAVFLLLQVAVPLWVRPHLLPPTRLTVTISKTNLTGVDLPNIGGTPHLTVGTGSRRDWLISNVTVGPDGRAGVPKWLSQCVAPSDPPNTGGQSPVPAPDIGPCLGRLASEGYRQHVAYQPASRFWPLQLVETGLYLALSAVVAAVCLWWIRRRTA